MRSSRSTVVRVVLDRELWDKLTEYRAQRRAERNGSILQVHSAILELLNAATQGVTPAIPIQDRITALEATVEDLHHRIDRYLNE